MKYSESFPLNWLHRLRRHTHLPTYVPTNVPTYVLYLPMFLPMYLPIYLPAYLHIYLCLVCYKPMAPLHYQNTTYLVKLWYFKGKGSVDQIDLLFQKT